jgi:F-type H+-transporting ATPase subunit b
MLFLADFNVLKPEPGLLIWTTIIFLLFWFLMSRFAFKPIGAALKQRENDIQSALDEARKAREEMSNLQAENEKLLAQAREERSAILKEAKDAKDERKVESAIQDIENQKMAALVSLKNEVGSMAVEIAEKILRRELANKPEQENYAKSLADNIKMN